MQCKIGKTTVTRIEEMIGPMFDPVRFFPDYDPGVFEAHREWLYPAHAEAATQRIVASMHSWLIETPHHKVLVDTCIGNDKDRMPYRNWHGMNTGWMSNLSSAGVTPDDIDFVMCTHLHVDHVGWNTCLKDGQWVPTFPNAKYIFAKKEYEFWRAEREHVKEDDFAKVNDLTFDDSVVPILHLAEMVEGSTELIADLLTVQPAPGHTPGSLALSLTDGNETGLFTGDICHHPIQVYEPDWNSAYCELPVEARSTRRQILEQCAGSNTVMLPAHFGPGFAGYVREDKNAFRFEFLDGS